MNARVLFLFMLVFFLAAAVIVTGGGAAAPGVTRVAAQATEEPAPPETVDLAEVAKRVEHQASYWVSFSISDQAAGTESDYEMIVVREPASLHFTDMSQGAVALQYIKIGAREWIGLGTDPVWLPAPSGETETMQKMAAVVLPATLGVSERQATISRFDLTLDGVACHEYIWSEGDMTGSACLSAETNLPVYAEVLAPQSSYRAHFGRFNDPANVIRPPETVLTESLHIDDLRMALNGLSSFQWTMTIDFQPGPASSTEAFFWTFQGQYVQATQAWRSELWMDADMDRPSDLRAMEADGLRWIAYGDQDWVQVPPTEAETESLSQQAQPFYAWSLLARVSEGDLVAEGARTVNGVLCDDYLFNAEWTDNQGQTVKQEVRACVAPLTGTPMYIENVVGAGELVMSWELSHVDDPGNVFEVPEAVWLTPYYLVEGGEGNES